MLYIFLWSLIERFTFLAYGLGINPNKRNVALANDPDLNKAFTKLKNDSNFEYFKSVFKRVISISDSPGTEITWQFKNDFETECETMINFYYQLRSNITHRGKSGERKSKLLESSKNEI